MMSSKLRLLLLVRLDHLPRQFEDALNMIVIDVANHEQIDGKRILIGKATNSPDLFEPRFQVRLVDVFGSAVYYDQAGIVIFAEVQEETVALARASDFQAKDHDLLPQMLWNARNTSSMPCPWKLRSRSRLVALLHRICLICLGRPTSSE
jgi:hypothetical protein